MPPERGSCSGSAGADQVDTAQVERLIASLSRLLDPASAFKATAASDLGSYVRVRWAAPMCWTGCGPGCASMRRLKDRRVTTPFERVLFGLVTNRALAPSSKLAAAEWITSDVHVDGLPAVDDDACYRAMD